MDHPLVLEGQTDLRKRVIQFIKTAYNVRNQSNIIFVCGGNRDNDMRSKFRSYFEKNLTEYEIFFPEFAMSNYFSGKIEEPFDIGDFEELVGELSEAIVIFPEAAGSYAETGYFSKVESLSKRSILALDLKYQGADSFISQGPAKTIGEKSIYQPNIQLNYEDPNFNDISLRIRKFNKKRQKKSLVIDSFKKLSQFEIFCLLHEIINILSIAKLNDIEYILNSIFKTHYSKPKIKKLISILVGSGYLREIGDFGHLAANPNKPNLLEIRNGFTNEAINLRLELTNTYDEYNPEFVQLVEEARNAN